MTKKDKAKRILDTLSKEFPDPETALDAKNPLELLIATILSAQCTDARVNLTTPALFKKFKSAKDYAGAKQAELEEYLKSINFFRNKTKSIQNCCKAVAEEFSGKVPSTVEELTSLAGVGRKTANIILGNAFGIEALAVDTHVKRVATRLGLTTNTNPDKIEFDLTDIIPEKMWTKATHLLIFHGRKTCNAKKPLCDECKLREICDYYKG